MKSLQTFHKESSESPRRMCRSSVVTADAIFLRSDETGVRCSVCYKQSQCLFNEVQCLFNEVQCFRVVQVDLSVCTEKWASGKSS